MSNITHNKLCQRPLSKRQFTYAAVPASAAFIFTALQIIVPYELAIESTLIGQRTAAVGVVD